MLIINHKSNVYSLIQMKHQWFLPSRNIIFTLSSPTSVSTAKPPWGWLPRSQRPMRLGLGQSEAAMAARSCTSTTSDVPKAKHRLEGISFLSGGLQAPPPPLCSPTSWCDPFVELLQTGAGVAKFCSQPQVQQLGDKAGPKGVAWSQMLLNSSHGSSNEVLPFWGVAVRVVLESLVQSLPLQRYSESVAI